MRNDVFGLCLVLAGGCSSSSGGGPADAGADAEDDGGGGGDEVFVVSVIGAADDVPIGNATVAFDLGGVRTEIVTGTDGLATFRELAFGDDTASVTAYRLGYGVVSYVGLGPRSDVLQVRLQRRSPVAGSTATILGTATGMTGRQILVTSTVGAGSVDMPPAAPDYEVVVAPDTAGTLVALDYEPVVGGGPRDFTIQHLGWALKDHPAVADVDTVNLDFLADAATSISATGTLILPARTDSPLRTDSQARITIYPENVNTLAGVIETATLATDRFDLTGRYVVVPGSFEPQTIYSLRVDAGSVTREVSSVTEFAYPSDGFEIDNFLDSPEVTSGVDLVPIDSEIAWTAFDTVMLTSLRISTEDTPAERVWDVYLPEGATSVVLPELPGAADPEDVLGDTTLAGRVILCDFDDDRNYCVRQSISRKIELIP
jgi:hypothetical protein